MAATAFQPRLRRFGLYLLILLALGLMSAVGFVVFGEDPLYDPEELFETGVLINPEKQPRFVFPEELRSTDLSLNRFIDRFFRLCATGKYPEVRLMLSQRSGESLPPNRFESMFNAMKEARIMAIKRLPDVPKQDGPAYVLVAEYDLESHALKTQKANNVVRLLIRKEEGEWRLGPVSRDIMAKIEAYEAATSQPAGEAAVTAASGDQHIPSKVMANQPVKIEPDDGE
ncbi:MAG: hypothetical protein IPK83_03920 [Planctomycetes bacterium]|nr:hypothetical protein [Planctomycetota bacterium]